MKAAYLAIIGIQRDLLAHLVTQTLLIVLNAKSRINVQNVDQVFICLQLRIMLHLNVIIVQLDVFVPENKLQLDKICAQHV